MSGHEDTPVYAAPTPSNLGHESSLSNWVGPYVTEMLGRGAALGNQPYTAYTGDLTAGASGLQEQAFTGLAGLTPTSAGGFGDTMGTYDPQSFTGTLDQPYDVLDPSTGQAMVGPDGQPVTNTSVAGQYMNPYIQQALNPQLDELRRQSDISRLADAGRLTQAGAYGGSRQAIMESEGNRNLLSQMDRTLNTGYRDAYNIAQGQFNTEEDRRRGAQEYNNQYGFDVLGAQGKAGETQRGITSEGVAADYAQFKDERDWPYKQVQYMQSLLQNLPMEAQSNIYSDVDPLSAGIATGGGILGLLRELFPGGATPAATPATPSDPLLKTDLQKIGEHNGHNLYSWKWNVEGERLTGQKFGAGVLATEVLEKDPDAVVMKDGYLAVNYSRIF